MTLVYATSGDWTTWSGATAPTNLTQLLRSASLLVREATQTAYYDTDTSGLPTDATIKQAFNDATCAQVTAWVNAGIDPTTDGLATSGPVRSKGIGTARLEYDTTLQSSQVAFEQRQRLARTLCDESRRILQQAGVGAVSTGVWIVG